MHKAEFSIEVDCVNYADFDHKIAPGRQSRSLLWLQNKYSVIVEGNHFVLSERNDYCQ